jgi:hypothetical protein
MIANIGANTFLIFMGFDILATVFCFFLVKETRGKNLEVAAGVDWEVVERAALKASASERGEEIAGEKGTVPGDGKDLDDAAVAVQETSVKEL